MKTILLCSDNSAHSNNINKYAVEIARRIYAKIIAFHSCSIPVPVNNGSVAPLLMDIELLEKNEKLILDEICDQVKNEMYIDRPENIYCESRVNLNIPASGILEEAKAVNADLIIMGSRCVPYLQKMIGTTSTIVAEETPSPVLVIPHGFTFSGFKKIIFSTDLSEKPERVLQVIEFAKIFNSSLDILHINDLKYEGTDRIKFSAYQERVEIKADYNLMEFHSVTHADTLGAMIEYVKHKDGELLVMFKHHYDFFKKIFHKSVTNEMIFNSEFPVLVLH